MVEYYLISDHISIIDLFLFIGKGFPRFRDGCLKSFFCDVEQVTILSQVHAQKLRVAKYFLLSWFILFFFRVFFIGIKIVD